MFSRSLGPLGLRFAAAFVGVALFAVAVFSAAVLIADQGNVAHLATTQRDRTAAEVSALAENAYRSGQGWSGANLSPLVAFASEAQLGIELRDQHEALLLATGASLTERAERSRSAKPMVVERTIRVDGHTAGRARIDFPSGGVTPGDSHLRSSLFAAVAWSAGLAAVAAIVVGLAVARGVIRPVRRLALVVKSLKLGQTFPRVGPKFGPGELGELGRSFDAMADSLEQEDRLRRALVADVAHELRTPVSVMQAETEALNEASGLELNRRALDLGRVAADAVSSLTSHFHNARIDVRQDLPPTGAIGDPRRLHQVAVNLLTNALKFTPPGGTVTMRSFTDDAEAVLEVTDSGPGIPEGERDAIWERFYRGSASSDEAGSGIGLAVVKELVDAHGGTVTVHGRPGRGARFVVRLPASPTVSSDTKTHG
jgi:signal transduction histidine kinase